jgi:hypothetical protein
MRYTFGCSRRFLIDFLPSLIQLNHEYLTRRLPKSCVRGAHGFCSLPKPEQLSIVHLAEPGPERFQVNHIFTGGKYPRNVG